jgi:hypothetical protein
MTLTCTAFKRSAFMKRPLITAVSCVSPARSLSEETLESRISFVTLRTLGTSSAMRSASARVASSHASPVRSTVRLKAATLMRPRSPTRSAMRLLARDSIALSSSCVPVVRRSSIVDMATKPPAPITAGQPCKKSAGISAKRAAYR